VNVNLRLKLLWDALTCWLVSSNRRFRASQDRGFQGDMNNNRSQQLFYSSDIYFWYEGQGYLSVHAPQV